VKRLFLAVALAAALPAGAQLSPTVGMDLGPSPRWGSVDIGVTRYRPNLDGEFAHKTPIPGQGAYRDIFGTSYGWMFDVAVSKAIFTRWGTLEAGFRTGYFQETGKARSATAPYAPATDDTAFKLIPTSAVLTYRFDWLVERYGVPFAFYGRAALERYNWWITDGNGKMDMKGATNGWSVAGGAAFLLDVVDRTLAREFDRDSGVNHTYLFFEVTKAKIDDFGSSKSWDLSPQDAVALSGGMTFVF
jgi:hypothetical protein